MRGCKSLQITGSRWHFHDSLKVFGRFYADVFPWRNGAAYPVTIPGHAVVSDLLKKRH
jgi:hypothetical protein